SDVPWPTPADGEERWLGPEFVTAAIRATLAHTHYLGEAIPSYLLMGGWAVGFGSPVEFQDRTIWLGPTTVDWDSPPTFDLDWDDPWLVKYRRLYQAVLELAGWDDFLVGKPCLLPGNDLLIALLGPDEFMLALVERAEWVREAIIAMARQRVALFNHFYELAAPVHAFPYGNAQWMPFWAPERYLATQSDVSCMLSPAMFDACILPELEVYGEAFGALWCHLDGARALQHLPTLLSRPYLRVMQFVPEPDMPPNGPEWLQLYRRIQAAGVIVHVQVAPADIEPLVKALDPALLCLDTWCDDAGAAEELLADVARWTRG
ncbi:MAG TPA: hypothetical protein PLZ36_18485, partial [Armatimonadota bacterium]|nr:hypothetical protein [Armatimonadota bacterium]